MMLKGSQLAKRYPGPRRLGTAPGGARRPAHPGQNRGAGLQHPAAAPQARPLGRRGDGLARAVHVAAPASRSALQENKIKITGSRMATTQAGQQAKTKRPPSAIYRALVWGLLLFCISFALIGGVIAEQVMAALNCQFRCRPRTGTCSFLQNALASRLIALSCLQRRRWTTPSCCCAISGASSWSGWRPSAGARHAYQNPRQATAASRASVRTAVSPQQRLHQFLHASFWILLAGLIAFCIAFGTPFLSTYVSREILQALGCNPAPSTRWCRPACPGPVSGRRGCSLSCFPSWASWAHRSGSSGSLAMC
jgi:hypothetical protein